MNIQDKGAHRRFLAGRTTLLFDEPFWGALSSRLSVIEDPSCRTAWTDGVSIGYNPVYVAQQNQKELIGLLAHETEHCARGHPWRRGGRDHKKFNVAADLAINGDLRRCGFVLPKNVLYPEQYGLPEGKSAEWYYDRLPADAGKDDQSGDGNKSVPGGQQQGVGAGKGQDQDQGQGSGGPWDFGEVRDAPATGSGAQEDATHTEEGWRQAVIQAGAIAQGQGKLPAGLDRLVNAAKKSRVDWVAATIRFAQEKARSDYSWRLPNPRYLARGLYLPSLFSQEVGILAIGMDSSGSIDDVLIKQFTGCVQAIADQVRPRKIVVFHSDAKVHLVEEFEQDTQITLHPKGGGGTDFRPVFDAIAEMEEAPAALIYLTDLAGTFPGQDPGIPTLWVTGQETRLTAPFGDVLCAA